MYADRKEQQPAIVVKCTMFAVHPLIYFLYEIIDILGTCYHLHQSRRNGLDHTVDPVWEENYVTKVAHRIVFLGIKSRHVRTRVVSNYYLYLSVHLLSL